MSDDKIYLISLYLDREGLKERETPFAYKLTPGGYRVDKESGFGGKTTQLRKDDILRPDSKVRENLFHVISFYTWAFPDQREEAKKILYKKLTEKATEQKDTSLKLFNNLPGSDRVNSGLLEAAKGVLKSWDDHNYGEKEELKNQVLNGKEYTFWSPAGVIISSEYINALRLAIEETEKSKLL